jgi:SNF2 family DNA or RNA helicase
MRASGAKNNTSHRRPHRYLQQLRTERNARVSRRHATPASPPDDDGGGDNTADEEQRLAKSLKEVGSEFWQTSAVRAAWLERTTVQPLYPTQEAAIAAILAREATVHMGSSGALLREPMGKGKTLIVIMTILRDAQARVRLASSLATSNGPTHAGRFGKPTLIVTPKHLLEQWRNQFRQQLPPETLSVQILATVPQLLRANFDFIGSYVDVVLTTYESLKAALCKLQRASTDPAAAIAASLFGKDWHRLVMEEASVIINDDTHNFACVQAIRTKRRLLVTATPLPNARWHEFRTLLTALGVDIAAALGTPPVGDGDDDEAAHLQRASNVLKPFIVNECPFESVAAEYIWVDWLTAAERDFYYKVDAALNRVPGVNHLARETTLQYLCLSPVVMLSRTAPHLLPDDRPCFSKMAAIIRYVQDRIAPHEKGLVFAHSKRGLYELAHHLRRAAIECLMLTGDTKDDDERQRTLQRFCNPDDPTRLLLCTHKKVGLGTDGLQRVANHVLILDQPYVPADEEQAYGRVNRAGQQRFTYLVKFILLGTVEYQRLLVNKEKASRLAIVFPTPH